MLRLVSSHRLVDVILRASCFIGGSLMRIFCWNVDVICHRDVIQLAQIYFEGEFVKSTAIKMPEMCWRKAFLFSECCFIVSATEDEKFPSLTFFSVRQTNTEHGIFISNIFLPFLNGFVWISLRSKSIQIVQFFHISRRQSWRRRNCEHLRY